MRYKQLTCHPADIADSANAMKEGWHIFHVTNVYTDEHGALRVAVILEKDRPTMSATTRVVGKNVE